MERRITVQKIMVVPASRRHAKILAHTMRAEDKAEVLASNGYTPRQALMEALRVSQKSFSTYLHGELAAIYGIVMAKSPTEGEFAIPWVLTGEAVNKYPRDAWVLSKRVIEAMLKDFPLLVNMVDSRHAAAIRWLKKLGFEIGPPQQMTTPSCDPLVLFCRATLRRAA